MHADRTGPDHHDITTELSTGADVLDRWFTWVNRVSVVLLVLTTATMLADPDVTRAGRLLGISLTGVLVGWHVMMIGRQHKVSRRRAVWYLAVAVPIIMVLFQLHPAYKFLAFTSFWTSYALLQPALLASIPAALLILALMVQLDRGALQELTASPTSLGASIIALVVGGVLSFFIDSIVRQSEKQRVLIEQLASTRIELAKNERAAGQLAERQRLAGEIHDTIAQDLTSIVLHLEAARTHAARNAEPMITHIDIATSMARSGLNDARQIVHALLPDVLVGRTITDALRGEIASWQLSTGVSATFQCHGAEMRLRADAEITLLRLLQESLTNVRKHANATNVDVTLSYLEDEVILDIRDNGDGMESTVVSHPSPAKPGMQVGLRSMRDRLEAVGGSLTMETAPGEGLTISASIPVGAEVHSLALDTSIPDEAESRQKATCS